MMYSMCYGRHTPGAHVHCAGGVGGGGGGGKIVGHKYLLAKCL